MDLDDLISRFTGRRDERWDICAQLYNALESGGAEPIDLTSFAPSFASFWRDIEDQVRPFQRSEGTLAVAGRSTRILAMKRSCCWIFWAMYRVKRSWPNCSELSRSMTSGW